MVNFFTALGVQALLVIKDRNFEVILFLASWSPIKGMREETRFNEAVMVALGAFFAIGIQFILMYFFKNTRDFFNSISLILSPIALWVLNARAVLDYRKAIAAQQEETQAAVQLAAPDPEQPEDKQPGDKTIAQRAGDAAGAVAAAGKDAVVAGKDGLKAAFASSPEPAEPSKWERDNVITAFFMTMFTTFCISFVSDQNQKYLLDFGTIMASLLGVLLAVSLAVGLGTWCEIQLTDRRYLLSASVVTGLAAISATCRVILYYWVGGDETL